MKKREFTAAAVLALFAVLSVWNLKTVDSLTDELIICIVKSQECSEKLDIKGAEKNVDEAIERWLNADGYTHIFIRHSEIDSTSDALYELKEAIQTEEATHLKAAYEKVCYHLESINSMEHPSIGSIL